MTPEEKARVKIDQMFEEAGWQVVDRDFYSPTITAAAIREGLLEGNREADYFLFLNGLAVGVLEAKRKEVNVVSDVVCEQAIRYTRFVPECYRAFARPLPFIYVSNGEETYFRDCRIEDSELEPINRIHTPKEMVKMLGIEDPFAGLPTLSKKGLRDCQYDAEVELEKSIKAGKRKALSILATGSGKTYLACLASYRLLNYTPTKRVLFLVDRNNLARQAETEFSLFNRTENGKALSELYRINRLRKTDDIKGDVVISTIQKLFAVMTGQPIPDDDNEDLEDELNQKENDKTAAEIIQLGNTLTLQPDYFQFIVIDECHRSIYGKWKAVLDYFSDAIILGLTATPTPEAYAYFNNNVIERYTYDESVVDGVNVPARVYRIKTKVTVHGGTIGTGESYVEVARKTGEAQVRTPGTQIDYAPGALDRAVVNPSQIEEVLTAYKKAIYSDLYPDREAKWEYIPKTLIFAKDDNHASEIVQAVKNTFKTEFGTGEVPEQFVQKITYSAGDSNALIRDFRNEKEFRIAVTVTLVATGTDIRPLEVVLFMSDVKSDVLYTQMKGRGCRIINDDKLKEVTPNAATKECYYIVDAVGVTESVKSISRPSEPQKRPMSLEHLLEHLAHGEVSDENLELLRDYCSTTNRRYENNPLFGRHLAFFINTFGFAPRALANDINTALEQDLLPPFLSTSEENTARKQLIVCLIGNLSARKKLLEMQKGYYAISPGQDTLIYAGFSQETAKSFIDSFEKYISDNKDSIEALRIIYNSESIAITHDMLCDLRDKLLSENRMFTPYFLWSNYKIIDFDGSVEQLDVRQNANALTHLIQLVRFAFKKNPTLTSLYTGYSQRFNLYCGQVQRTLTDDQAAIMKQIADYIVSEGSLNVMELNSVDTDLWRKAIKNFGAPVLAAEMQTLSKFVLRVA